MVTCPVWRPVPRRATAAPGAAGAGATETVVVPVGRASAPYAGGIVTAQAATAAQKASCRERMVNLR